jgi:hypothetical protein
MSTVATAPRDKSRVVYYFRAFNYFEITAMDSLDIVKLL